MKQIEYGLVYPEQTDKARDFPAHIRQVVEAVRNALNSFDYQGADPNLVLSRVAALENASSMIAYESKTAEQELAAAVGTSLTTISGAVALAASVTVSKPTLVKIETRVAAIVTGSTQIGVNLTGATSFTTPTDHPSVGKPPASTDSITEGKLVLTLNPGTTVIRLAHRSSSSALKLRNPSILVQRF